MAKHRTGYLFRRTSRGNYYLQYRIGGKLFCKCLGTANEEEAETKREHIMDGLKTADEAEALAEMIKRLEGKKGELAEHAKKKALTVKDAWKAFDRAGGREDIASSTMQIYLYYWNRFTKWLAKHYPEAKKLRDVSFEMAEAYKQHLTGELKVTAKTFNEHRSFLQRFFSVLDKKAVFTEVYTTPKGNETKIVWGALARKKSPKRKSRGRDPLTTEELMLVCRTADGELRVMLALGLYLGARMGDAATLNWGNVDLRKGFVRYTPRKLANLNDPPVLEVPIHPTLHAVLSETPSTRRKGHLTPAMAELYTQKGPYAVSAIVQRHFKKCGLVTTKAGTGVRRLVSRGFHSLRHSAVSIMRGAGAAQTTSQAVVGHNSAEIHELYSHTDSEAMRRAVYALPSFTEKEPDPVEPEPRTVQADPILELVKKLTTRNVRGVKAELLELLT